MRLLSLLLCAVLAASSLLASTPTPAAACTCAGTTRAESEALADIVFVGAVVDTRESRGTGEGVGLLADEFSFLFAVDEVRKGSARDVAVVNTYAGGGAACGAPFNVGERWLVYGHAGADDRYRTNLCVPNELQAKAGDAPTASVQWPENDDGVAPVVVLALGSLAAISAIAFLIWRRRSSEPDTT